MTEQDSSTAKSYAPARQSLEDAMLEAQKLAFAPVSFMSCIAMKRIGVFAALENAVGDGLSASETAELCSLSTYAASILLESGLAIGALRRVGDRFHLTRLGHVLALDSLTAINFDFIYDVCFKGLFHLQEALQNGRPEGLKELGSWPTVYQGLSQLPDSARRSWLAFDHHYSDSAFAAAIPIVLEQQPGHLLDIGGNTGRFARACLAASRSLHVTIADLPSQISLAQQQQTEAGVLQERLHFHPCDLLDSRAELPSGFHIVWMSQFLVCFSEDDILRILEKARAALREGGCVLILETFWDRQAPIAAFCLLQTSAYFTAIANGQSKMYETRTILQLAEKAGLRLERIVDGLGISHSLLVFHSVCES